LVNFSSHTDPLVIYFILLHVASEVISLKLLPSQYDILLV